MKFHPPVAKIISSFEAAHLEAYPKKILGSNMTSRRRKLSSQKELIAHCPNVTSVKLRPVLVPLDPPLRTASGVMANAPLVLVDVETDAGVTGHAYFFTYSPTVLPAAARLAADVGKLAEGQPLHPRELMQSIRRRFVLLGTPGLLDMALAGIDMALWDAHARSVGLPLSRLLGGDPKPIKAYASFGMDGLQRAVTSAEQSVEAGFLAVKIKIGYPTLREDLDVVNAVLKALGDKAELMIDYNQALSVPEALRRTRALDDFGLAWIEEPIACDDLSGHSQIRQDLRTAIQLGENSWGPKGMLAMIRQGASDLAMPDLMKVGGVSGWLDAVAICEAHGMPISNHFYQEASAHLLAITPFAHYLEYFGIADGVLAAPLKVTNGYATASNSPGSGVEWDEDAVKKYAVQV
ncbi:enolase C-terminal domain-like protein [Paraburkholderia hospita]|uniref:enolase C-terminal domain-like protein n=1 Tax=Paraburkholderia hospita TaxID=169430 RepID=UPI001EE67D3A|nr:enolase C-terminal domain-like protein [Paraburkholderia hospita]